MTDHVLDDATLTRIFDTEIRRRIDRQTKNLTPGRELVIVGGQPGAGKTKAGIQAAQEHGGLVPVLGDELRRYHPDYDQLMATDPVVMPAATAQASGRWVEMSLDHLRESGYSVLLETTLRQPQVVTDTVRSFRDADYTTQLRIVAVPEAVSLMGTAHRYLHNYRTPGRWTDPAAHDRAYEAAPATIETLVHEGLVDRITMIDATGRQVEDAHHPWPPEVPFLTATLARHREPLNLPGAAANQWLTDLGRLRVHTAELHPEHVLQQLVTRIEEHMPSIAAAAPAPTTVLDDRAALHSYLRPTNPAPTTGSALHQRSVALMQHQNPQQGLRR